MRLAVREGLGAGFRVSPGSFPDQEEKHRGYDQGHWQFSNELSAEAPGRFGKTQTVGPYTLSSSFDRPGWGLSICVSNSYVKLMQFIQGWTTKHYVYCAGQVTSSSSQIPTCTGFVCQVVMPSVTNPEGMSCFLCQDSTSTF